MTRRIQLLWAAIGVAVATAVTAEFSGTDHAPTAGSRPARLRVSPTLLDVAPDRLSWQLRSKSPPPRWLSKAAGHYSLDDWRHAIDSTWGPGPSTGVAAARFDLFWNTIDERFACFQDLNVDWDSIGTRCLSEITDSAVSRGRLAAILNHAARALQEGHTTTRDSVVYYTQLLPGVPLMMVGGWGVNDHFGAALTPLPDSSLLVYKTVADHPLGLESGDLVVGYDRIPWKELYPQLLKAELPLAGIGWGSSESSYTHALLMAAGLNWHLFDTIDIVKYHTGDTLHLPTSLLAGHDMSLFATEQMDVPGVPMPDLSAEQLVSWGVVEGTQIGYVYCLGWFYDAVQYLWPVAIGSMLSGTDGLIIDLRTCYGGNPIWACHGLELLFDRPIEELGFDMRADPDDHLAMQPTNLVPSNWLWVNHDSGTSYENPIAVLIGPGCVSMGDFTALLLTFHEKVRLFGKPTSSSFNSPDAYSSGPEFWFRYARSEAYLLSDPGHYLTRDEFPDAQRFPWVSFEEVWLTPSGVAQGKDDVVEAAVAWVTSATDVDDDRKPDQPSDFVLLQNYPNPFNLLTTISFTLPRRSQVSVVIRNILGQLVKTLLDDTMPAGSHRVEWDGTNQRGDPVAGGVYFYTLRTGRQTQVKKMMLLK